MVQEVVLIAVGGPTSSGKTTLARQLLHVLPSARILHQDDFAPPSELIPIHPEHKVQDWDDPSGAIDWQRFYTSIDYIRRHEGKFHPDHHSHHHLNSQSEAVSVSEDLIKQWRKQFASLGDKNFIIIDGFQLYCVASIVELYDINLFISNDYQILKARREERDGYHTAVQSNPEGALWKDPPGYWDNIVWPAYIKGNRHLFKDGNIANEILPHGPPCDKYPIREPSLNDTNGNSTSASLSSLSSLSSHQSQSSPHSKNISEFILLDGQILDNDEIFDKACRVIADTVLSTSTSS